MKINEVKIVIYRTIFLLSLISFVCTLGLGQPQVGINNQINQLAFKNDLISEMVQKERNNPLKIRENNNNSKPSKLIVYYSKGDIKYDVNHPLNMVNYKNLVLSKHQLVVFASAYASSPKKEDKIDTSTFIITFRFNNLLTPCLNRSVICSHNQFTKEFQSLYPELDYSIPQAILSYFINPQKASLNCLILNTDAVLSLSQAAWICHDELKEVNEFEEEITKSIQKSEENYSFFTHWIKDNNSKIAGVLELQKDQLIFITLSKQSLLNLNYSSIVPYATAMYLKSNMPWSGNITEKPEESNCFKITYLVNNDANSTNDHFFCVLFGRNDIGMSKMLSNVEARWYAEIYTNKINNRLQKILLEKSINSLEKIPSNSNEIEISKDLLDPIKCEVRNQFFLWRHYLLVKKIKTGLFPKELFETEIEKIKERVITSVCNSIKICIHAIQNEIKHGTLVLSAKQERFAMDMQNPYKSLMPKELLKVNMPNAGALGQELMKRAGDKVGTEYLGIVEESYSTETPSKLMIKRAFNSVKHLNGGGKRLLTTIQQLGGNCRLGEKYNINNLKRKIALLFFMGDTDPFLASFTSLRDSFHNLNIK